ncbi:MAG TPA: hypothetical protein ENJ66_02440, partial [Calditrichae bacterium]|nr:hypothetical protein [Calditrichia bacterium]
MVQSLVLGVILLCITQISAIAQDSSPVRWGIGVTVVDFQDVSPYYVKGAFFSPNLLVSMTFNQRIMLEPGISYYRVTSKFPDSEESENALHFGGGVYWLVHHRALTLQFGGFYEYLTYSTSDSYGNTDKRTMNGSGYAVGPALGIEYR